MNEGKKTNEGRERREPTMKRGESTSWKRMVVGSNRMGRGWMDGWMLKNIGEEKMGGRGRRTMTTDVCWVGWSKREGLSARPGLLLASCRRGVFLFSSSSLLLLFFLQ
jgi:hypothetical protein